MVYIHTPPRSAKPAPDRVTGIRWASPLAQDILYALWGPKLPVGKDLVGDNDATFAGTGSAWTTRGMPELGFFGWYHPSSDVHLLLPDLTTLFSGSTGTCSLWVDMEDGDDDRGFWHTGSHGNSNHFAFSNVVYDGTMSTSRKTVGNVGNPRSDLKFITVTSAASDWRFYINGQEVYSTTSNTFGVGASARRVGGSFSGATYNMIGTLGPFTMWDRVLSAGEVQALYDPRTRWDIYQRSSRIYMFAAASPATDIQPTAGALTLTGESPGIALKIDRSPSAAGIAIAGQAPGVARLIDVTIDQTDIAMLALEGQSPTVGIAFEIAPTAAALTLAGQSPAVALEQAISPSVAALAISGQSPTVEVTGETDVVPTAASLALSGESPSVALKIDVAVSVAALTLTGQSPGVLVEAPGETNVIPTAALLALAGESPTVALKIDAAPGVAALAIAGQQPGVARLIDYALGADALTLAGQASTVALKTDVSPSVAALALSGETVSVQRDITVSVTAGALAVSGETPTVSVVGAVTTPGGRTIAARAHDRTIAAQAHGRTITVN